jgi:hypothetical protein
MPKKDRKKDVKKKPQKTDNTETTKSTKDDLNQGFGGGGRKRTP